MITDMLTALWVLLTQPTLLYIYLGFTFGAALVFAGRKIR
jgi:hypothetical protein